MMESSQFSNAKPDANRCVARRWVGALVGVAALVVLATPAWATRVTDVRVGKHPTYTRVVFELDRPSGYQLERNEPAPGIAELVVSLRAASIPSKIAPPKDSLIESIEIRSDGKRMTAHIRLVRGGLRLKEMMLSEPARIVLDVVDGTAEQNAKVSSKPAPVAVPVRPPVIEPVPEPEPVAPAEVGGEFKDAIAAEAGELENQQGASAASSSPQGSGSRSAAAAAMEFASNEAGNANSAVEPAVPADTAVQVAGATRERRTPPAQQPPATVNADPAGQDEVGLFNLRNGAFALAGAGLLAAGGFVIARRRRYADEFEDDDYDEDEAFSEDNPFARLERPVSGEEVDGSPVVAALDDTADEEGIVVGELVEDESGQTDLFAQTPPATEPEYGDPAIVVGGDAGADESSQEMTASAETRGSDVSMDGTSDLGENHSGVPSMPPLSSADNDALMRLVREMEERIADVETRLEETVDAKERLERQVAAQTEELRVQRAAIARTQRAVRNMSQPVEDTPTEPALREPSPDDQ